MKKLPKLFSGFAYLLSFLLIVNLSFAQKNELRNVKIPDIPSYYTLKCDFHMHTVFSDGLVWPSVRVDEAVREGIDVIALTDHVEYRPFKADVKLDLNRPFDVAKEKAEKNGVILIKGAEITRQMPPGHFNAIFLKDANALDVELWEDAFKIATEQGAFVFWNHPGWRQENEIPIWYAEHTKILKNKWISGIEIVNENSYYPLAYQWALDSNLCILGNSDIHDPIEPFYDPLKGEHRPLTLVFSKDKTRAAIKEALFEKRTAVYCHDTIFGNAKYLEPLVNASIEILDLIVNFEENGPAYFRIKNNSGLYFVLNSAGQSDDVFAPGGMILNPGEVNVLQINRRKFGQHGIKDVSIPFVVENFLVSPDKGLHYNLKIKVNFGE